MENLFRKEVLEHKRHRLEGAISLVQPPMFYRLSVLIVSIVIVSVVFLSVGSYTRKERVTGFIEPNTGVLKLQAPYGGQVEDVLVSEGEAVEAGQPLLRIASIRHSAQGEDVNQTLIQQYQFQRQMLTAQLQQVAAQHQIAMTELRADRDSLANRLLELEKQAATFAERLVLNKSIVEQISTLQGSGYISELELKRQQDTLLSLNQQASAIYAEQLAAKNQIAQIDKRLEKLPFEHEQQLASLNAQLSGVDIQLASAQQQSLAEIRAPKAGIVTGLLAKSGKSVQTGQHLLSVLPIDSEMQAVIYVPTEAFGFIQTGQQTKLRYHAFPYEKFGIYDGVVKEVSNSVILPEEASIPNLLTSPAYRVVVALTEQQVSAYGKATPLRAGMTLDADIVIEERSLLRWLFDPVFSIKGQL